MLFYCRRMQGLEHPTRWPERFGRPSCPRPPGEGLAALPLITHCFQHHPDYHVLLTTTTTASFQVIKDQLPEGVIYQFFPLDIPYVIDRFLGYWSPFALVLMESELWPNLIISASAKGIAVTMVNARMSVRSFNNWLRPLARPLISFMLSNLALIAPLSTAEAVRFQLLQASPYIINFAGDLKYAVGNFNIPAKAIMEIEDLQKQFCGRPVWMAASIHKCEQGVVLWVHEELMRVYPDLLTIIVPRHPQHGQQMIQELKSQGINVALRSKSETIFPSTSFYVVDTLGELRSMYRATPIAVIGGSFAPSLGGHNISEAAAAGCAVLTGPHVGHFSHMVMKLLQSDSFSVLQVEGKRELTEAVSLLLGDAETLKARQNAARRAFSLVSEGVIHGVWNLMDAHVLKKGCC
ncbi:probable 3-deoxy-D-manno-octulosonic acid transferase, mitochondrial [Dioscorea cayenensis subsp. rotundata]|uniref:lipid IVA 3-deoxy-D-manno-octulosonic acid transferase n=1 Tax=Dioscorea cayennensis subsp. rotundata TaxID=55577 RepID=A0AB40CY95_DIOCR|nr:probable 3-deoxy-D-manno-octulosonic acid transferase, mitochondrial [Dioscorea cayenensis subsp. rotundata]